MKVVALVPVFFSLPPLNISNTVLKLTRFAIIIKLSLTQKIFGEIVANRVGRYKWVTSASSEFRK